jgi:hypothetical protein
VTEWIPTKPDPALDWAGQVQVWSQDRALGGGWALDYPGGGTDFSPTDLAGGAGLYLFSPVDFMLHPLTLPGGATLDQNLQVDSRGRLHEVIIRPNGTGLDYRISTNGGRTWNTLGIDFPPYNRINTNTGGQVLDFRVNAALGIAAINTRTNVGSTNSPPQAGSPEQDWVYKVDVSTDTPHLLRRYTVGLGNNTDDTQYHPTYETAGHRYDFASIAILTDGRIATSFMDEKTVMPFPTTGISIVAPAVAVEQKVHGASQTQATPLPNTGAARDVVLFAILALVLLAAGPLAASALRKPRRS